MKISWKSFFTSRNLHFLQGAENLYKPCKILMILHEESKEMPNSCKNHFFSENHIILWKCNPFMKNTEICEICDFHASTIEKVLKYQRIIKHPRRWSQKSAKSENILFFCRRSAFSRKYCFFIEKQKFHGSRTFRIHLQENLHNRCIFQWFLEVESKETAYFSKFTLFL